MLILYEQPPSNYLINNQKNWSTFRKCGKNGDLPRISAGVQMPSTMGGRTWL